MLCVDQTLHKSNCSGTLIIKMHPLSLRFRTMLLSFNHSRERSLFLVPSIQLCHIFLVFKVKPYIHHHDHRLLLLKLIMNLSNPEHIFSPHIHKTRCSHWSIPWKPSKQTFALLLFSCRSAVWQTVVHLLHENMCYLAVLSITEII